MTIHNETTEERNARIEREEDARDSYKKAMDSHNEEQNLRSEVSVFVHNDVFNTLGIMANLPPCF